MPDTLVRKRSAKLQEYERMFKSDPRSASEGTRVQKAKIKKWYPKAKQVFSALNAQLMAELPKLSALAESLFLSRKWIIFIRTGFSLNALNIRVLLRI